MIATAPTAVAAPVVVSTQVTHFEKSNYFPAELNCDGVRTTEIAEGTEHSHVIDRGDSYHLVYGETFRMTVVYDDGRPDDHRHGTDAWMLQVPTDGHALTHESFDDFGPPFGNIQFFTTFVVVDGDLRVDHTFFRNPPEC